MTHAKPPHHSVVTAERRERLRAVLLEFLPPASRFTWEVGCGHGHFLSAFAAAHPERLCVGIDISSDRVARAVRKRERAHLSNLHFMLADADDFLAALPEGARISEVFILFPDPWPKRRHHKNRVMKPGFLDALASVALQGSRLHFRTDHEPYFNDAEAVIRAHANWTAAPSALLPFEEPTVFQKRAQKQFTLVAERR